MRNKRWLILLIVGFLLIPFNFYFVPNASAAWWGSDWDYYKTITIESDYIDNDLTYFPVLVNSTNVTLIAKCQANGEDVVFVSLDNTTVFAHEIEEWNPGGFTVHVNISETLTSGSDYEFLMYYGNPACGNQENPSGVWDSDYVAVYHMNDNDGGLTDSTSNSNDATEDVSDPSDADDYEDAGKIGYAVNYDGQGGDGDSENHDVPNVMSCAEWRAGFTISAWFKFNVLNNYETIVNIEQSASIIFRLNDDNSLNFITYDGGAYQTLANIDAVADCWYHGCINYDGTTKEFFINGSNKVTAGENTLKDNSNGNHIGANFGDDWGMDGGVIDEFRISKVNRDDSWVIADFHNQNQSSHLGNFLSWGSEQAKPPGDPPTISTPSPSDVATGETLFPALGVTIGDVDVDTMNITWWSNVSGTWEIIGMNLSDVGNGTYYQKFDEFAIYGLRYWWNVSVTDGVYIVDSGVFSFTVEDTPSSSGGGGGGMMSNNGLAGGLAGGLAAGMFVFALHRRRKNG